MAGFGDAVTVAEGFEHVIVPSLVAEDNVITGNVLSAVTVTTLLFILLAQPLPVFVTITLKEPAAVNEGVAVVSVPGTIPVVGDQL